MYATASRSDIERCIDLFATGLPLMSLSFFVQFSF